jgi:hypothetical protein
MSEGKSTKKSVWLQANSVGLHIVEVCPAEEIQTMREGASVHVHKRRPTEAEPEGTEKNDAQAKKNCCKSTHVCVYCSN